MLIPAWLYTGAFYGLIGIAGIALLYYVYRPKQDRPPAGDLPVARIPATLRHKILEWLPLTCLLGGGLGACGLNKYRFDVVEVVDGEGEPAVHRRVSFGRPSFTYAPEQKPSDSFMLDSCLINHSTYEVMVKRVSYGTNFGYGNDTTVVPPGTGYDAGDIEYIGPGHQPPSSLDVKGVEAKMGMTSRSWLTWKR